MKIVACVKLTPDPGDIQFQHDGSLSLERAEWAINVFDLQALESAVRLAEAGEGNQVIVLSAGPHQISNSKLKKDILSRGADALYMVVDDALANADTAFTAAVLARAITNIGDVGLVLCGEGSADLYFQQVGLQVGERLGLPTLNAVSRIEREGEHMVVERDLDDELEVIEVPLPAVFSVTTDITQARLPSMKQILLASKKPVSEWKLADIGIPDTARNQIETLETRAPQQVERKQVRIDGSPDEAAQKLLGYLRKENIL